MLNVNVKILLPLTFLTATSQLFPSRLKPLLRCFQYFRIFIFSSSTAPAKTVPNAPSPIFSPKVILAGETSQPSKLKEKYHWNTSQNIRCKHIPLVIKNPCYHPPIVYIDILLAFLFLAIKNSFSMSLITFFQNVIEM